MEALRREMEMWKERSKQYRERWQASARLAPAANAAAAAVRKQRSRVPDLDDVLSWEDYEQQRLQHHQQPRVPDVDEGQMWLRSDALYTREAPRAHHEIDHEGVGSSFGETPQPPGEVSTPPAARKRSRSSYDVDGSGGGGDRSRGGVGGDSIVGGGSGSGGGRGANCGGGTLVRPPPVHRGDTNVITATGTDMDIATYIGRLHGYDAYTNNISPDHISPNTNGIPGGDGGRGGGRVGSYRRGRPPPGYTCFRCDVPGHWITQCLS